MKNCFSLLFGVVLSAMVAKAQTPTLLAPGVISTGKDYCTTLSPEGDKLYFVRNGENGRDAILVSTLSDNQWGDPVPVSFTGNFSDTDPMLSPDGTKMYFMTDRNAAQDGWKEDYDIWVVEQDGDDWGKPYRLPDFINSSFTEGFPCTATSGNMYFFRSNTPGHGEQDIWVSKKVGGGFDTPSKLSGLINTEAYDGHPFVSPDESYLIYYSYKSGGYGSCDLYISFREGDNWKEPINLGNAINTNSCEMVPFVSRDGKTLYFTRYNSDDKSRNIFYVRFDQLLSQLMAGR